MLAGNRVAVFTGPTANEAFFRARDDQISAKEAYGFTVPIFGKDIAYAASADRMSEQLDLITPALSERRLRTYVEFIRAEVENYVARWPQDARDNGRDVSMTPVVGSVVVFNPGQHLWSSTHYWDYGDGHVAVVVKVDSSSYTVADFNFNLGGGGRHIMSFRRIPWPDPYPNSLSGPSVLADAGPGVWQQM